MLFRLLCLGGFFLITRMQVLRLVDVSEGDEVNLEVGCVWVLNVVLALDNLELSLLCRGAGGKSLNGPLADGLEGGGRLLERKVRLCRVRRIPRKDERGEEVACAREVGAELLHAQTEPVALALGCAEIAAENRQPAVRWQT